MREPEAPTPTPTVTPEPTPTPDPGLPEGTPTITSTSLSYPVATIRVAGPAGASVVLSIDGAERARTSIGDDGTGALVFTLTLLELATDSASISYVSDTEVGPALVFRLWRLVF